MKYFIEVGKTIIVSFDPPALHKTKLTINATGHFNVSVLSAEDTVNYKNNGKYSSILQSNNTIFTELTTIFNNGNKVYLVIENNSTVSIIVNYEITHHLNEKL